MIDFSQKSFIPDRAFRVPVDKVGMRYADLDTPIKSYVDNITTQMTNLVRKYHFDNYQDFIHHGMNEKMTHEDVKRFALLMKHLTIAMTENKIPPSDKEWTVEIFLHLREQYDSQLSILKQTNLVDLSPDGTLAITGVDGKMYPVPTYEQIADRILQKKETLLVKADQGFTKLLLVPFGMSLDQFVEKFRMYLKTQKHLSVSKTGPIWIWDDYRGADVGQTPKIVYDPQQFNPRNHHGKFKREIIEDGWRILLLQTNPNQKGFRPIPQQGTGYTDGITHTRQQIEANKRPEDYLLDTPPDEHGQTLEEWITMFITQLEETREPLDNNTSNTESFPFLTGMYFKSGGSVDSVPCATWDAGIKKVNMSKLLAADWNSRIGSRFSVRV